MAAMKLLAVCLVGASANVMSALKRNHIVNDQLAGEGQADRYAWDDCGGKGASASMKIRALTAKLNGAPAPRMFIRNAAQNCDQAMNGLDQNEHTRQAYPEDSDLYAKAMMSLGKAEEVTHAGLAELGADGKNKLNQERRAAETAANFADSEARQMGA